MIPTFHWQPSRRLFLGSAMALAALACPAVTLAAGTAVTETDVMVPTPDGMADAVLFQPEASGGHFPVVLLWHDLGGLRPVFRAMGRRLAGAGYVVLLPNAFYRSGPADGATLDMAQPEVREGQMAKRAAATDDGIARDSVAYLAYLDGLSAADSGAKAGTVGFDLGASYAFRAAAAVPGRIGAVAGIHPLGTATSRPNSPHLLVPQSKAAYYVDIGKDADAREPMDKDDIAAVIAEAGLTGTVEVSAANHGFAVPGHGNYDEAAAQHAWAGVMALLKANLVQPERNGQ